MPPQVQQYQDLNRMELRRMSFWPPRLNQVDVIKEIVRRGGEYRLTVGYTLHMMSAYANAIKPMLLSQVDDIMLI